VNHSSTLNSNLLARRDPHRRDRAARAREDNVETARRCFAAFNRSFAGGAEDYYELLDADVEWRPLTSLLDGRCYRGPDDVRRWIEDVRNDWRVFEISWSEVHYVGNGRVLAFGVWHCVGRRAGVPMRFDNAAWLIEIRGGKMTRLQTFVDRGEARKAAGLAA
jgi:ketosteroid isomerase-like protein